MFELIWKTISQKLTQLENNLLIEKGRWICVMVLKLKAIIYGHIFCIYKRAHFDTETNLVTII